MSEKTIKIIKLIERFAMITLFAIIIYFGYIAPARGEGWNGEVYAGYILDGSNMMAQPDGDTFAKYMTDIEVGYTWKFARGFTGIKTLMDDNDDASFHPASSAYRVGIQVRIMDGPIIEYKHECWHPVDSGGTVEEVDIIGVRIPFGERW